MLSWESGDSLPLEYQDSLLQGRSPNLSVVSAGECGKQVLQPPIWPPFASLHFPTCKQDKVPVRTAWDEPHSIRSFHLFFFSTN